MINPYVDFKFNFFGLVGSISNGESPIGIIIPFGTDDWHMDTPRCDYIAVGAVGAGGAAPLQIFKEYLVKSTRRADYAHHITYYLLSPLPGFSDFPTDLDCPALQSKTTMITGLQFQHYISCRSMLNQCLNLTSKFKNVLLTCIGS